MTEKEKVIQEIMDLTFLINEQTAMCTFIRFSGHVDVLYIDISESKEDYTSRLFEFEARTTDNIVKLYEIRDNIKHILEVNT